MKAIRAGGSGEGRNEPSEGPRGDEETSDREATHDKARWVPLEYTSTSKKSTAPTSKTPTRREGRLAFIGASSCREGRVEEIGADSIATLERATSASVLASGHGRLC